MIKTKPAGGRPAGSRRGRQSFAGNLLAFCAHCTAKTAATQAGACFGAAWRGRGAE